jgi:hypothetical protein
LLREHANLSAMMSFMGQHVAQHFHADRPGLTPAVPLKLLDAATTAERFREHFGTARPTIGQRCAGLRLSAMGAIELNWDLQVRSCQPDPLTTNIVHVRKDGSDAADLAGRFRGPCVSTEMLDNRLIYAIIDRKYPSRGPAELRIDF